MRIALVGNDFGFRNKDGVSRYAFEIYKHLSSGNDVQTYEIGAGRSFSSSAVYGLRRLLGVRINEDAEVVHVMYPNAAYPLTGAPVAVTWHDANVFSRYLTKNPFSAGFYHYFGVVLPALRNTKRADGIIYVSEETKRRLARHVPGIGAKQSAVIPEGIDEAFVKERVSHGAERRDFVYVGSVEFAHKNIEFLINSFEASRVAEKLYIFTPTSRDKIPKAYFSAKNVSIVLGAGTSAIISKLKSSIALLHFSLVEGFGLTILESMAVGTPAVVLEHADIPAIVTKYAIKAKPEDVPATIRRLARERPELANEAVKYAKGFSWRASALKTLAFYKRLSK
ncbi:MAG: glycosyltransferase [Candidatus Micrarchaeia archaeon]